MTEVTSQARGTAEKTSLRNSHSNVTADASRQFVCTSCGRYAAWSGTHTDQCIYAHIYSVLFTQTASQANYVYTLSLCLFVVKERR